MRVLVFQGWVDPGGRSPEALLDAWPTLPGVAAALADAGARVEVVVAARHDAVLERGGVRYRFVRERRTPAPRRLLGHRAAPYPFRALRAAARHAADVVHVHGLSFPLHAHALRRSFPATVIVAQDHADLPPRGWRVPLHRWGLSVLDGALFTARPLADEFVRAGVLRPTLPVFEVVEGSTGFAPGSRETARAACGAEGAPCVLWVGGMTPHKDPHTVLDAVAAAASALPCLHLWMTSGGGPLEGQVRARVEGDALLRGRVHLVGRVEHRRVEVFLRAADVLVSASRREGSGYAVIEALACGTPVILSDIPAHRALLGGAPCGGLVPAGDTGALAAALEDLAPRLGELRRAARARFEAALSFPAIARQLGAAYGALLRARGGR